MSRFFKRAATALALVITACMADNPVAVDPNLEAAFDISDGANGGFVDGFFWQTPTVKKGPKNFSGTFDPNFLSLNPTIDICKIASDVPDGFAACVGPVLYTLNGGSPPENIVLDAATQHYIANWQNTNGTTFMVNMTYRALVNVGGITLGWVDLKAVAKQNQTKSVGNSFAGFVPGSPFQFKFRVETGIAGGVVVTPPGAMIFDANTPGESQVYTATVTDLYANPLSGKTVGWTSSHPLNASVVTPTGPTDGSGQSTTTASSDGRTPVTSNTNVTITATVGAASGSETLLVKPSLGTLKVIKNSGENGTFDLTGSAGIGGAFQISTAGAPAATGMQSFSLLVTTTYDVSETLNPDFDFVSAACTLEGGGATGAPSGTGVTGIVVEASKTTTCTFTNSLKPGSLTVIKNSDADGSFDFSATSGIGAFQLNTTGAPSATDQQTFSGLDATVNVDLTETLNPAFDFLSAVCLKQGGGATGAGGPGVSGIDIEPGKTTTCTFTNMQKLGTLTVVKDSDADGSFDFTGDLGAFALNTTGGGPSTASQTFGSLNPNVTYDVSESLNPDFDFVSATCLLEGGGGTGSGGPAVTGVVLEPGKTTTCTFVNAQKPGALTVIKNSGANGTFDFVAGGGIGAFQLNTTGQPAATDNQTFSGLDAEMNVDITESANAAFDFLAVACTLQGGGATGTPGASTVTGVDIEPGKTTTCTFTNAVKTGSIKVIKNSDADGSFDFTGDLGNFTLNTTGAPSSSDMQTFGSLDPLLTYDVTETLNPDFDFSSATCLLQGGGGTGSGGPAVTGIVVEPGKLTTCTFTNALKPASITVVKNSDADGSFDFTGDLGNFTLNTTGAPAATDQQTFPGLDATATFDITETLNPGFDFNSVVCTLQGGGATGTPGGTGVTGVGVEPGKTTTCTFTNDVKTGSLKVIKNSDADGSFDFTGDVGNFTLNTVGAPSSTDMQTFASLDPLLTYDVTETLNPDFDFGSASCVLEGGGATGTPSGTSVTGIVIEGGKTTTCTYTNTVKPGSITVVKNSGADGSFDFTGDLGNFTLNTTGAPAATDMQTFGSLDASTTFDITETANVDFDFVSVACTLQGGGATGTPGASTVTGVGVEPGKTTTCTFTNSIKPGSLTVVKNSDADATFNFTGTGAVGAFALTTVGAPSATDQQTFNSLDAAITYDLTETLNPSFDLDAVTCTLQGGPATGTANATGVTGVALEAGKTTTCTFTNSLKVDAIDDVYGASGNIGIAIPDGATDVVESNDVTPAGSFVAAVNGVPGNVGIATATTNGGFVTMLADGSFTYEPPAGLEGADDFMYTLSNAGATKSDAAKVTINVIDMVWFIDDSSPNNPGTGTFSDPFRSPSFVSGPSLPGHTISLASGSYTSGINLLTNQALFGQGVQLDLHFTADANSVAAYQTFAGSAGARPTITASGGNGINLASGNTVRGLDIGNTSGTGIIDNGGTVGTLTISDVSITGTGRGIEADNGGTLAVTFDEVSSSNAQGIDIAGASGTFDITTGTISSGTANAVDITGSGGLTLGVTLQSVSSDGGSTTGINLNTVSGTFHVTGTGTSGSGGTIENKSNTDGIRLSSTGGLVTLEDMIIEDISHPSDGSNTSTTFRSGADAIHGENVNGGLTLDGVFIRRISDNAINGAVFSDGVSATSWNGIQILNSVLENTNRFHLPNLGDSQDEGIARIRGLTGTVRIINSTIRDGARGFDVETLTGAGTMDMTVQGSVFDQIYKAGPFGGTTNIGIRGISVVVSGSHDGVVRIGDPADTPGTVPGTLGNVFTNNATASIAVLGQTGHTGDIDVIISKNQFIVNDHLTPGQAPGNFIFNFPQGGVALVPSGGTFDAIVSHNTFDQVMHAAGGFGQLSLSLDGGLSQVHVHDNTFTLPWDAALHVRADGSSAGTEVLIEDNIYADGFVGSGSDDLGSPFPSPFQGNFVTVRNGGVLDLTWRDEVMPLNDTGNGTPIPQSFRAQTQNQAGNLLNLSLTNNAAPNGYDFIHSGGTFNLFTTGSCPATAQAILLANGNTGGGGVDGTSPPTVSTAGTITCTTAAPGLPSIIIP